MADRSVSPEDCEIFAGASDSHDDAEHHAQPEPAPALTWQPRLYCRMDPGAYEAAAVRYQGPEWVRAYGRWGLLIEFDLDGTAKVCAFYNFGRNPKAPRIAERGYYFRDWCKANGGKPRPGEEMSPEIFLGRTFAIEVRDSEGGGYSVVSGIESTQAPKEISSQAAKHVSNSPSKQEAFKQEPLKQSSNATTEAFKQASTQPIKQLSTQAPKQLSLAEGAPSAPNGRVSAQAQAQDADVDALWDEL